MRQRSETVDNQSFIRVVTRLFYRLNCWKAATEIAEIAVGKVGANGNTSWQHLRSSYGINHLTREAMFLSQGGHCAICDESDDKKLAVDHCHESGRVRGLLCHRCNTGLGSFREDEMWLDLAVLYLQSRKGGRFSKNWSVWDPCPYLGLRGVKAADNVAAPHS